jgi:hypothetical protein
MFRDVERPKYEFLDNEARIDAASRARQGRPAHSLGDL